MARTSSILHDKYLRIIGMPLLSVVYTTSVNLSAVISEHRPWWKQYFTDFIFVFICWSVSREIIAFCRRRYPGFPNTFRRVVLLFVCTALVSFVEGFLIVYLLNISNYYDVTFSIVDYFFTGGLILVFSMMIVSVYELLYSLSEWKQLAVEAEALKKENLQSQLDVLKEQVKPHFLFNSLNSLLGLIDEDKARAKKFVEELSFVYRYLLQSSEKELIPLSEELDFIKAYYYLLKTRFEEGLMLDIYAGNESNSQFIPPLTLQILLENAVKHNEVSAEMPLHIIISSEKENQMSVSNNLQRKTHAMRSTQKGLANLFAKYKLLHQPPPEIFETKETFRVSVPLIQNHPR